jgi:hypothetical protein
MSGTHKDRRRHRRKVANTAQGLREHHKRDVRRGRLPSAATRSQDEDRSLPNAPTEASSMTAGSSEQERKPAR